MARGGEAATKLKSRTHFEVQSEHVRIIAGKYRGRKLKSPPSLETRPTSDRLRETLFNVLAPRIKGARFLDLCAGSGAVGIESLSRAAAHATFVDQSRRMCALIEANLKALGVGEADDVRGSSLAVCAGCAVAGLTVGGDAQARAEQFLRAVHT